MESPSKIRLSLLPLLLGVGLAFVTPVPAEPGGADTSLTKEALQLRGAGLDNFIYEVSDSSGRNTVSTPPETPVQNESRQQIRILWMAAGGAALAGLGMALLLSL